VILQEYLLRERLLQIRSSKQVHRCFEVLNHYLPDIKASDILDTLNLEENKYFCSLGSSGENINNEISKGLMDSLNLIASRYGYHIVSTHPRTQNMIDTQKKMEMRPVQFLKPMGFNDYNALQMKSFAVLSDSNTISEESSTLNFPALNIRDMNARKQWKKHQ
jgi:UDP-N-acetylglucosamine 2-epimerase (non-hydrolysing)